MFKKTVLKLFRYFSYAKKPSFLKPSNIIQSKQEKTLSLWKRTKSVKKKDTFLKNKTCLLCVHFIWVSALLPTNCATTNCTPFNYAVLHCAGSFTSAGTQAAQVTKQPRQSRNLHTPNPIKTNNSSF